MPPDSPRKMPQSGNAVSRTHPHILTVVFVYAVFASLWILLSDRTLGLLFTDPARITLFSTLKGWVFVCVTSLLLYGMMRRLFDQGVSDPSPVAGMRPQKLPLVLIIVAVLALTGGGIAGTIALDKGKEFGRLKAIAEAKARQIGDWLDERRGNARFVHSSGLWIDLCRRWIENGDTGSRDRLQRQMTEYAECNSFQSVLLLNGQGELIWGTGNKDYTIGQVLRETARKALAENRIVRLGPYADTGGRLNLDFVTPLIAADGNSSLTAVLRTDPTKSLFEYLKTWPVPTATGEALLFRREGNQLVFLNQLRHYPAGAMELHLPVTKAKLPAAMLLRKEAKQGELVEGLDYRGMPAMAVGFEVPGTDWFLLAKLDQKEFYSEASGDTVWVALAGLLTIFAAVSGTFVFLKHQELVASLRERKIQAERLEALYLLDAIAEGSADIIYAKDTQGHYLLFNREAARIMDRPQEEVLGLDDTALFPPEQASIIMTNDMQVMQNDHCLTFQEDLTTRYGETTFLATKGPLHDQAGNVTGMFGIARDITERKRAEEILRRFELLVAHSRDIILFIDCDEGNILDANPAAEQAYGYTQGELLGLTVHNLRAPGALPLTRTQMEDAYVRGILFDTVHRRKDGTVFPVEVSSRGTSVGGKRTLISIVRDITERKNAEEALRRSAERHRSIIQTAMDGFVLLDMQGRLLEVNESYCRMSGYNARELSSMNIVDLETVNMAGNMDSRNREILTKGEDRFESHHRRKDGTTYDVEVCVRYRPIDGGQFVCFLRDITERKQAEKVLRDSLEEKIALLKEVHHRVKNNLQIVASLLSLQANRAPNEAVIEVLHDTRNRVRSMAILHEVLYHSENLARINLASYLSELCTQLLRSSGPAASRVKVEHHVAPVGLGLEQGVPCGLIVSELVSNSLKHGFPGDRRGRVVVSLQPEGDRELVLNVRDDGIGLPSDFNFTETSTLGLKLVLNLAGQLHGRLEAVRLLGGGASFTVTFPNTQESS